MKFPNHTPAHCEKGWFILIPFCAPFVTSRSLSQEEFWGDPALTSRLSEKVFTANIDVNITHVPSHQGSSSKAAEFARPIIDPN
jgi:hypothetical protein